MAEWIVKNVSAYEEEKTRIQNRNDPVKTVFKATISQLQAMFLPAVDSVSKAVKNTAEIFKQADRHANELKNLQKSQDFTPVVILGTYSMSKDEKGKFILNRCEWHVTTERQTDGRISIKRYIIRPKNSDFDYVQHYSLFSMDDYQAKCACGYEGLAEPKINQSSPQFGR